MPPIDALQLPLNHVRRADRAMNDDVWIADLLHRSAFGFVATAHDGQPFINSNLFVYVPERHCIYTHTARTGRTPAVVGEATRACFSIASIGRLLPADTALEMSSEYEGVVAFGRLVRIEDMQEMRFGLQALLDKYFTHLRPGHDYRAITDDELARTAVYRLDIDAWNGKRKQVEPDFAGAFWFGQPPPGQS
jgi:hypothetical protein